LVLIKTLFKKRTIYCLAYYNFKIIYWIKFDNKFARQEQRRKRQFSDVRTALNTHPTIKFRDMSSSSHHSDLGLRYSSSSSHHSNLGQRYSSSSSHHSDRYYWCWRGTWLNYIANLSIAHTFYNFLIHNKRGCLFFPLSLHTPIYLPNLKNDLTLLAAVVY
jgi:hypothetical protein